MTVRSFAAALAAALVLPAGAAFAQAFPARPITLICPWPPGGSTDTHLRKFAEVASKYVGQNIIIEQFDQIYWYKSSDDYAKWAAATFTEERATIARVSLLAK